MSYASVALRVPPPQPYPARGEGALGGGQWPRAHSPAPPRTGSAAGAAAARAPTPPGCAPRRAGTRSPRETAAPPLRPLASAAHAATPHCAAPSARPGAAAPDSRWVANWRRFLPPPSPRRSRPEPRTAPCRDAAGRPADPSGQAAGTPVRRGTAHRNAAPSMDCPKARRSAGSAKMRSSPCVA
jgi:hypothetical protein